MHQASCILNVEIVGFTGARFQTVYPRPSYLRLEGFLLLKSMLTILATYETMTIRILKNRKIINVISMEYKQEKNDYIKFF